jgi:hypothetical protein
MLFGQVPLLIPLVISIELNYPLAKVVIDAIIFTLLIFVLKANINHLKPLVGTVMTSLLIQANSHKPDLFSPESIKRTLSAPTGLYPAGPDIVWNSNISPTTNSLRGLYKFPYSSNNSLSLSLSLGHSNLLVLKLISFISKGPKHSTLDLPLQILDLGIE